MGTLGTSIVIFYRVNKKSRINGEIVKIMFESKLVIENKSNTSVVPNGNAEVTVPRR